jgi:hypothetical protein
MVVIGIALVALLGARAGQLKEFSLTLRPNPMVDHTGMFDSRPSAEVVLSVLRSLSAVKTAALTTSLAALSLASVCLGSGWLGPADDQRYTLSLLALLSLGVLLEIGHQAFLYRLRVGLFGTNEYEVRQLIRFLLAYNTDQDLSGGLGAIDLAQLEVEETEPLTLRDGVPAR